MTTAPSNLQSETLIQVKRERRSLSPDRRAQQTERQMNEGFEQFLATIIERCLDEHDMQPPYVVRTVGDNGSALVVGINGDAEPPVVLTKHGENDTFTLPMKITIVSQNNRTARLVIERDGNIGRFH
ncbi:MAG: hypothetical protein ACJ8EK_14460 [Bradyrhizobium sp.]